MNRWLLTALTLAAVGCDNSDGGVVGPETQSVATGRVEQPTETYHQPGAASRASTAEVARVSSNGSLTVIAAGSVSADGSYRIEGVPSGRSDLVVVARSSSGAEVGRVLLAGQARAAGELVVAPITAESTVQGLVYSELRAAGSGAGEVSPAELELMLQMDAFTAAAVARSQAEVRALARAYAEAQSTETRAFARLGHELSAQARQEILMAAQAEHHLRMDQGASSEASYDLFLSAAVDAFARSGASAESVVLASAAARVAASQTLSAEGAAHSTQTVAARAAARVNLAARLQLLAEVPQSASDERRVTADALIRARTRVRLAGSAQDVESAMASAESEARQSLAFEVSASLTGLTAEIRARVEAAFTSAYQSADLSAELDSRTTASARADAVASYRQRVHAAAQAWADSTPSTARVDASAAANLLIAARAG